MLLGIWLFIYDHTIWLTQVITVANGVADSFSWNVLPYLACRIADTTIHWLTKQTYSVIQNSINHFVQHDVILSGWNQANQKVFCRTHRNSLPKITKTQVINNSFWRYGLSNKWLKSKRFVIILLMTSVDLPNSLVSRRI